MKTPLSKNIPIQNIRGPNLRQLVRESINIHRIKNGDVILVKAGSRLATAENVNALADSLGRLGFPRCLVAVADDFSNLEVLNEDQMRALGWVRVPTEIALTVVEEELEDERHV